MSNSRRGFFQIAVLTLIGTLFTAALLAHVLDQKHSATPCAAWEKDYWKNEGSTFIRFNRVSSFFWSSLCASDAPPLIISASEGLVEPAFITYFPGAREFTGAHKGIKTFGYLAGHQVHRDRAENLRAIILINPVYFSFAASTDATSIRLNALSPLSYTINVPSYKRKWDSYILDWPFMGLKAYLEEWTLLRNPPVLPRPETGTPPKPVGDADFDPNRNMYKERAAAFTSYRARFSNEEEPTRTLFEQSLEFALAHPESRFCFVMLPLNAKNLRFFKRDAVTITAEMEALYKMIPEGQGLNLLDMNETPKIFWDPMHFNAWGVGQVAQRILESDCARRVLGAGR